MNRKFLENLFSSIEDEDTKKNYVNAIMQEHGKDIEKKNNITWEKQMERKK